MLRQWDIDRRVVRPIEIGERALSVVGLAVALILLRTLWQEVAWAGSAMSTEALASAAIVVTAIVLMAIVVFVGRSIVSGA